MVHAGHVFVAGFDPSRELISGSFESVYLNAWLYRLDLTLWSHPKEW